MTRIAAADGRSWEIRRRVLRLPRWRGFAQPELDPMSLAMDGTGMDSVADVVLGLVVVALLVVALVFVWPLIVFGAQLLAAAVVVLVRVALGRWIVTAETDGERYEWRVRGRRSARELVDAIAESVRAGAALPAGAVFETTPSLAVDPAARSAPTGNVRVLKS